MPLLSEIEFGSYLVYSPSGQSAKSQQSNAVCRAVKHDSSLPLISQGGRLARVIPHVVGDLAGRLGRTPLAPLFAGKPMLVPAPRSSLVKQGTLSPPRVICQELVARGLGSEVQEALRRIMAVPKAAFQQPADRPTAPQHYASLSATHSLVVPAEILLVDDVVTSGTMLLASVSRLREAFPTATVRAFALVRTMSGQEVDALLDPCLGVVKLRGERGHRVP